MGKVGVKTIPGQRQGQVFQLANGLSFSFFIILNTLFQQMDMFYTKINIKPFLPSLGCAEDKHSFASQ